MIDNVEYILIGLASVAAGIINALAGGGTLITFPLLIAIGIPPIASNVTNTVALCPGYIGGAVAQMKDLKNQKNRLLIFMPTGVIGGAFGAFLLLNTSERFFNELIPYLIFGASVLLMLQNKVRNLIKSQRWKNSKDKTSLLWLAIPVFFATVYGGYFGAGLSVIILAVLGLLIEDSLTRLNAIKQLISFSANISAAIYFLFSGEVVWLAALVMSVGALSGGWIGGYMAGIVKAEKLRIVVVIIGFLVAIIYFLK